MLSLSIKRSQVEIKFMNAVITGGTKGIGKAIVCLLAEKGINIATCARNANELADLEQEIKGKYPDVKIITKVTDVSNKDAVLAFADFTKSHFDTIDILVNNAGVFIPGACHSEDEGALEMMIQTNLYSAYHLTRSYIPMMKEHGTGHIFNMCSVASIKAYENGGSYSISKFALYGFTKNLREELKNDHIKVTAILPGATWSASWAGVDLPKSRLMEAEDIAKLVWSALEISPSAVIEDIVIRPQLGDL